MHKLHEELESMVWADLDRQVILARVERRKTEWATAKLSRCLVVEMVNTAVERYENLHLTEMLTATMEEVWKRVEVSRLLGEMEGGESPWEPKEGGRRVGQGIIVGRE